MDPRTAVQRCCGFIVLETQGRAAFDLCGLLAEEADSAERQPLLDPLEEAVRCSKKDDESSSGSRPIPGSFRISQGFVDEHGEQMIRTTVGVDMYEPGAPCRNKGCLAETL